MYKRQLTLFFIFQAVILLAQSGSIKITQAQKINSIGYELMVKGSYDEAKEYFISAIQLDSTQVSFFYNLSNVYLKTSNLEQATHTYLTAKRLFPYESDIYMYSGDISQKSENYDIAIQDYTTAIKIGENNSSIEYLYLYYFNRGNCYLKIKDYKSAVLDFDKTLENFPNHYGSYANRGMAKFNLKDRKGACKDWQSAYSNGYTSINQYIEKYCKE